MTVDGKKNMFRLEDLIDISLLQDLQEKLNKIYSFPSAVIDMEGKILTAVAWQDICTKFHRTHPECEKECIKSDQYIFDHLSEAKPAITYQCPHGLVDNATPIIIDGQHLGNFFTGQFFLEEPDMEFFRGRAKKFGFDEKAYLEAVRKVPIWSREKLKLYLDFIKGFIEIIAGLGLRQLRETQIKKELLENEEKFKGLFERAPLGYLYLDNNWNLLEVNNTWLAITGYSKEDVIGRWFGDFVAPEYLQGIGSSLSLFKSSGSIHSEIEMIDKKGERLFFSLDAIKSFEQDKEQDRILCILKDITDRRKAQLDLAEANQYNHYIVNNVEQGIIVYDKDLRYKVWNSAMERISGIPAEVVLGRYPLEVFPFLENTGVMENLRKTLNGESTEYVVFPYDVPHSGKKGWSSDKSIPLKDLNGEIAGVLGTVIDITSNRQTETELKNAKEKSENQEKQFKEFFNKAADPIFIAEIETGLILAANNAAINLTGLPREQMIGMHQSLLHPTGNGNITFKSLVDSVKERSNTQLIETRVIKSDGNEIPVEILSTIVFYQGKECLMGTFRDITQRVKKDIELKKALETHQFHIDNTPLAVIEFNNKLQIIRWSHNSEILYGWKEEEVLGKTLDEIALIHEDDIEFVRSMQADFISGAKTSCTGINRNRCKNGSVVTCEWHNSVLLNSDGSMDSVHSLIHNITERRMLEEKLNHSHNLMQYIIEHNRGAVAVHDKNLNYIYVSERYLSDYNIKEKNILGRHHYEVLPDLPQKWRDVHQRALRGEILSAEDDIYVRDNGKIEWTRWECRPWYETDGSIGGIIVYTEVITKQKETELALIKAKEKAEESDKLKTAFLRNMSHEVRTPLNAIAGFSQIIASKDCPEEKFKDYSAIILRSTDKLIEIITDITEMALIQSNQVMIDFTEINIIDLITEIAGSFENKASAKNNTLTLNQIIPESDSKISTDKKKLEKIITHIIDNAVKFTYNGTIDIRCSIVERSLQIIVSDTGIGISKKVLDIIFEPFRQADISSGEYYGGNGLGLAIVKEYSRLLNGTIAIESEVGKGTKVILNIPMVKTSDRISVEGLQNASSQRSHVTKEAEGDTILIVDDETFNFLYLKELLKNQKNRIIHAPNGKIAVDLCQENDDISLVLMDLKMPVMDGETAAKEIKKMKPFLPIIAQTAYILEDDKNKSYSVFDDYLTKPIKREVLSEKLEKFLIR